MKKTMLTMIFTAALILMLNSCSTTQNSRDDYFGYNNNPKEEPINKSNPAGNETKATQEKWTNPLSNNAPVVTGYEQTDSTNAQSQDKVITYYDYYNPTTVFVPVIVPWWSSYYGWMSYHRPYRFYVGWGGYWDYWDYWACDWYSPWYNYHPYYGSYWSGHHHWGHHNWYHGHHYYSYESDPIHIKKTDRNFGSGRGSITSRDNSNTAGTSDLRSGRRVGGNQGNISTGGVNNTPNTGKILPKGSDINTVTKGNTLASNEAVSGLTSPFKGSVKETIKQADGLGNVKIAEPKRASFRNSSQLPVKNTYDKSSNNQPIKGMETGKSSVKQSNETNSSDPQKKSFRTNDGNLKPKQIETQSSIFKEGFKSNSFEKERESVRSNQGPSKRTESVETPSPSKRNVESPRDSYRSNDSRPAKSESSGDSGYKPSSSASGSNSGRSSTPSSSGSGNSGKSNSGSSNSGSGNSGSERSSRRTR